MPQPPFAVVIMLALALSPLQPAFPHAARDPRPTTPADAGGRGRAEHAESRADPEAQGTLDIGRWTPAAAVRDDRPAADPADPGPAPDRVIPAAGVIATGAAHSCAIAAVDTLYCWGDDSSGQLGDGPRPHAFAQPVPVLRHVVQAAAGATHTCALTADRRVYCWGDNAVGQLGDGGFTPHAEPVPLPGDHSWTRIATGAHHTCALDSAGSLWCWGDGTPTPTRIPTDSPASTLAAGGDATCTLTAGGKLRCWGASPPDLPARAAALTVGRTQLCALLPAPPTRPASAGSTLACFPLSGDKSEMSGVVDPAAVSGDGAPSATSADGAPSATAGDGAPSATAGDGAPSGISGDGAPSGISGDGVPSATAGDGAPQDQPGEGQSRWFSSEVDSRGLPGEEEASGEADSQNLAGEAGARAFSGEVGSRDLSGERGVREVGFGTAVQALPLVAVSAGDEHVCGLSVLRRAVCWGLGGSGRLGNGSSADRRRAKNVRGPLAGSRGSDNKSGSLRMSAVAAGGAHTCALTEDGDVFCWGLGDKGQLGAKNVEMSALPVRVAGLPRRVGEPGTLAVDPPAPPVPQQPRQDDPAPLLMVAGGGVVLLSGLLARRIRRRAD